MLRPARPDGVEPGSRAVELVEASLGSLLRLVRLLECFRQRAVIGALGSLERQQRRTVLALPADPAAHSVGGVSARRSGALDPKSRTGCLVLRVRHPASVALDDDDAADHRLPNRAGLNAVRSASR